MVMSIINIVVIVINTRVKVMTTLMFTLSASAILSNAGNSASSTLTFNRS